MTIDLGGLSDLTQEELRKIWVQWAVDAFADAQEAYETYEAYYIGEHKLAFSTDRWEEIFGEEFNEFADNWCQVVVDATADRLRVIGWDQRDAAGAEKQELTQAAQEIWNYNNLETEEVDLYPSALTKGDGYLIVWPSQDVDGEIDIFFNDALNCNVVYDAQNKRKISRAAKHWVDEEGQHFLRLYFPDRTECYIVPSTINAAMAGGFQLPDQNDLPSGWEQEQEDIPNPYGVVPVFHFRNKRGSSTHGISELLPVIPIQNAVNKLLMDLMVASEFASFPQKWMTGSGQPADGWQSGANRIWASTDPNAHFGEFRTADLDPIMKSVDSLVGHIAKITATPMHYLRPSGDMPSGEALKTAEAGLIKKCENRSKMFGDAWGQAMTFALRIKTGEDKVPYMKPIWDAFEIRHDLEQAQTAQLKALLGIPLELLWKEHFGYDDEQIEEFKKVNADIIASIVAAAAAQTGQVPPTAPMGDNLKAQLTQVLGIVGKSATQGTAAGEAAVNPQPNTRPPASPTRRSSGFKD